MNPLRSVGVASRAYGSVLPLVLRPAIWLPFLLIAAVQFGLLGLLVGFHRPGISALGAPLVRLLGGERATHYPLLFIFLPSMLSKATFFIAVLVASVLIGVATLYFARALGMTLEGGAWRSALRRWPTLLLAALVPALIIYGLGKLSALVPYELYMGSGKVRWGVRAGMLGSIILLESLMAYAAAWIVLEGHKFLPALRDSIRVAARTFLPTLIVVAIPMVLLYPLSFVSQRSDLFLSKLRPEMVFAILSARIVGELVLGFLLAGAVTRLFLWRMEARR